MTGDGDRLSLLREALESSGGRWEAGETSLSSLSQEEVQLYLGYVPGPAEPSLQERERLSMAALSSAGEVATAPEQAIGFPASFDWRNVAGRNFISPVRNQGGCGSCVAFGTCATVEGTLRVQRNDPSLPVDLSEAHLFYCIARSQGRFCSGPAGGWWVAPALDGFKQVGVADESCYPYSGGDQECTNLCADWMSRATKVTGWHQITDHNEMKTWLSTRGPLAACLTAYDDFVYHYTGGVYHHVSGPVIGGHCVCIIGYDDAQGCWFGKNSWGTGWGESGFFKIAYGEAGIDATMWAVDGVAPATGLGAAIGVANNNGGRLEVFVRGTDGGVYHRWQTAPSNGWVGDWAGLGGIITSKIGVGVNNDGRIEIFARGTDNALYHNWQTSPGGAWSGWSNLGGIITSDPVVGRNADGRLEVFARGTDNAVWHRWQTAPGGGWAGWASMGGHISGRVAVGQAQDGRLELFARGWDNSMYHMWQTARSNGWSGWSGMGGTWTSDPAVGNNADGRLELFARGTDQGLWHSWQLWSNGPWTPTWSSLGGLITSDATVGRNADGRLEVFVTGTDFALYHKWQTSPNGNWSDWGRLGGILTSNPVVSRNSDGRLEVFGRGTDNALYNMWQTAPNNGWSDWGRLGGILTSMGLGVEE